MLALGATILWSGNFVVARGIYEVVEPATLSLLRWCIACLALLPLSAKDVWQERRLIWKNISYLLPVSFLGITLFNTLLYLAAHSTSALNLALIATSSPIFIILFSRFLHGELITTRRFIGLSLAIFGVVLIITEGRLYILMNLTFTPGDMWMLLAAMTFGLYSVLLRDKPLEISQASFLQSIFLIGLLLLIPWSVIEMLWFGIPEITVSLAGSIMYVGLGASLVSFALWIKAIEVVGPTPAGFIYYTMPLFSGVGAYIFLGEPLGWIHVISGVLIFSGIIIATKK